MCGLCARCVLWYIKGWHTRARAKHTYARTHARTLTLAHEWPLFPPPPPPHLVESVTDHHGDWRWVFGCCCFFFSAAHAWNFTADRIRKHCILVLSECPIRQHHLSVSTAVHRCRDSEAWTGLTLTPAPMRECCDSFTCSFENRRW